MYYSVFRFVYAHFIVAIIDLLYGWKKIWIKQYLICSCNTYVVTASVCGCVSTVSALKLRIFTVMDLKLHIWLHGCPVAEKLSVCHHYQDKHASIYFPKCCGPLYMWMGQSRKVYSILFLNLNLMNNYRDLEGAASTQLEQLGGDRRMTDAQS